MQRPPRSMSSLRAEAGRGAGQARLLEIVEQRPQLSSLLQSEAAQYGICTGVYTLCALCASLSRGHVLALAEEHLHRLDLDEAEQLAQRWEFNNHTQPSLDLT